MKIKKLLALLLSSMILFSVTACTTDDGGADAGTDEGGEVSSDGALTGDLEIWAWGADAEAQAREDAIEVFISENPELNVTYSVIPTADSVWDQKAAAALASDTAADVMQLSPDHFGLNTEYYIDLNPLVTRDAVDLENVLVDGMLDGYYNADGKLEGFPLLANCFIVAYNKDMFDEAGVAYPEEGWTLEDLLDWGSAFATGEGANQTYALVKHWVMNNVMLYAAGGAPYTEDLSESLMGEPEIVESLTLYNDLITDGIIPSDTAQQSTPASVLFISGKAAMYPMGGFEAASIVNDAEENGINLGYVAMPYANDGSSEINIQYATGYAITKTSENQDAAWEFLKDSAYQNDEMCKITSDVGMTSSKTVAEDYYTTLTVGSFTFGDYIPHMANTVINPYGGTLQSSGNIWNTMVEAVTLDSQDPAAVQEQYAPQIATEFASYDFNANR